MCFYRKKLKALQNSVDELTKIIKTRELVRLQEESKEYKDIRELLTHIRFKIKDIKIVENEYGKTVKVRYELPTVDLEVDENGNLSKNEFFYSTNYLELIDIESLKKINKILNELKK